MIRLITGFTWYGGMTYTPESGAFELPEGIEKHLVKAGAAEYVSAPLATVPAAPCGKDGGATGENTSGAANAAEGAVTPVSGGAGGEGKQIAAAPAEPRNDDPEKPPAPEECIDVVDGHMTEESLLRLTRKALEKLAAELGLDAAKCKNKGEIAALIAQVEVEAPEDAADDGEAPPVISAAMPL